MSEKHKNRDWKSIYQKYCESGMSVEKFSQTIGVSGSWVTENFRRLAKAGKVVYPLPKDRQEGPMKDTQFVPLHLTESSKTAAETADTGDTGYADVPALRITIGRALIGIPAGCDEDMLRSVLRIACEVC